MNDQLQQRPESTASTARAAGEPPLVSVIMPTFNSGKTVQRALASVFAQTYAPIEIVIADDASKDDTREKVLSLGDPRVAFLESSETTNKGPAATRNRALAKARGTYVAFIDSDDEWLPEKLAKQVAYLESHPDCSIVVSDAYDMSPDGAIAGTEFGEPTSPKSGVDAWRLLLKYSFIETTSVMTRLQLVRELGGFDPKLLVSQDQDLWIRLAVRGEVGIIRDILGRIHQVTTGHMTRNRLRQVDIMLPMIERHVARLSDRLSPTEIDEILGYRYQVVGRGLYLDRHYRAALKLLFKASRRKGNWLANTFFVCHASPIGVAAKARLKSLLGGLHREAHS